jgi:multiple sugar transport system ATP-binding protein
MGNHQVVWLQCGGQTLAVLVHDGRHVAAGDTLRFGVQVGQLSVFDQASEQRIDLA